MKPEVRRRNNVVRWGLIVLLAVDVVLMGVYWKLTSSPHAAPAELNRMSMVEKQYRADDARLERFRNELPADEKQWDEFFNTHFHPAGAGYSALSEDLGRLASIAGLRSENIAFHQHPPDARGLMEVDITTAVEGDYDSLLKFLNNMEHSSNFYILDSMAVASSTAGKLRLNLQLRTYFRTT